MRVDNWPTILDEQIKAVKDVPFKWGTFDCALFASDIALAMTGEDPAKAFRRKYKTKRGSLSALKKNGCEHVGDAATLAFGQPLSFIASVQRGDMVLFDGEEGLALGICVGAKSVIASAVGVAYVNTGDCICGWQV